MITVNDILRSKGREVWTIAPSATVFDALALMAEKGAGGLVVVEAGDIAGMMTERDYARKVILKGKSSKDTPVREIMSSHVVCIAPTQSVDECMALMTQERIRHLPVVEEGRLVGLVSISDVVKAVIEEKQSVIDQMEKYILGK